VDDTNDGNEDGKYSENGWLTGYGSTWSKLHPMDIHLRPELEEQIRQDIQRGPYQTVDEFVEHAVSLLHQQEAWFASHRDEIAGKIEQGWSAAERGELADDKEVQGHMQERKRAWIEQQRPA
jgi:Arc/MetJ-type ribon-helix-helix transcriptional regulator